MERPQTARNTIKSHEILKRILCPICKEDILVDFLQLAEHSINTIRCAGSRMSYGKAMEALKRV